MNGMDMGGGGAGSPVMEKRYTHMTFFWGKNSEILFKGWPGTRGGMYALALIVVFLLAFLLEWLSYCRMTKRSWSRPVRALVQTAMHAVRVGLMYLLMLAVMSFNVGVLIVTIAGHGLGFLLFGSYLRNKQTETTDLPPTKC